MEYYKISDGPRPEGRVRIIAEDHPFVGAEGMVVGTVPVNGLLLDVDGIDVRVPINAVQYVNEPEAVTPTPTIKSAAHRTRKYVWPAAGLLAIAVGYGIVFARSWTDRQRVAPVERAALAIRTSRDSGVTLSDYSKEVQALALEIAVAGSKGVDTEALAKYQRLYDVNRDGVTLWSAVIRATGYLFSDDSYEVREIRKKYPSCAPLQERFLSRSVIQSFWACTEGL
jgi:hypothetical protein